ncbi:MAG: hypothetical protein ACP5SB_05610 [Caldisericaceae bacterium]
MRKMIYLLTVLIVVSIALTSVSIVSVRASNQPGRNGNKVNQVYKELRSKIEAGKHLGNLSKKTASFLGMKTKDLIKERRSGKSLATIAADHGKTEQDLVNYIEGLYKQRLDTLLSKGKITQDEYNTALSKLQSLITKFVESVPKQKKP